MPEYTARVELDSRDPLLNRLDHLVDVVAPFGGAVATAPTGRVELLLTIAAADLDQAVTAALGVAQSAGDHVAALEVLTTEDFRVRSVALPDVPDLVSVPQAAAVLGVSAQRIRQLLEGGKLAGVKVGSTWAVLRMALEQRASAARTVGT